MRFFLLTFVCMISMSSFSQSLQSPDQFLGYELGSRYTPHYKVVQYINHVAQSKPEIVQLKQYGKTNENRELLLAMLSTSENMRQLEAIQKNQMRLSGFLKDQTPANVSMPTVVWLSYNVHGNETSSTEVSLKLLYEIASGNNAKLNEWLKNTVVVIDPCLNPDGRDRYVNWFNQMIGTQPDANPISREHDEPWPGGRSNHYLFDLNRDWAWQTQIESRGRMKQYNEWMPQIHCDFHEQEEWAPYYFAPAAEPFHEVITPWQRSFQQVIGKNHAGYFDANGWLYFTKEIFDLFYPSYGDTYPMYSGSIGMTYEQAGHSKGGLAVAVGNDTLTLKDRIAHHFTTSLSTIEISSKNSVKVNEAFKKYFDELNANGAGAYKTYVIDGSNPGKLNRLIELLDKNKIQYGSVKSTLNTTAYDFFNNKEIKLPIQPRDLVVSTCQPKGNLVSVLFEPNSKLKDSVTYDITAWSLPYVYGLNGYAIKEKINFESSNGFSVVDRPALNTDRYGYLIEYKSFQESALLSALLKQGIQVRNTETNLVYEGRKFNKGSLIVLKKGNEKKLKEAVTLMQAFNAQVTELSTGFMDAGADFGSQKVHLIQPKRIVLVAGEGSSNTAVGEIWQLFEEELHYPISLVNANSLENTDLKNVDVVIFADGNYKILSEKESNVKNWVRQGGKLIAIENAVTQLASGDWSVKMKKSDETPLNKDLKYENRERESVSFNTPGAIYKLSLDESHPLAFGYPDYFYSLKMSTNLLEFSKDVWTVAKIDNQKPVAGFVGSKVKDQIRDGALITLQDFGNGKLVCFVDNPVFRNFWDNGKMLLFNAVFFAGN